MVAPNKKQHIHRTLQKQDGAATTKVIIACPVNVLCTAKSKDNRAFRVAPAYVLAFLGRLSMSNWLTGVSLEAHRSDHAYHSMPGNSPVDSEIPEFFDPGLTWPGDEHQLQRIACLIIALLTLEFTSTMHGSGPQLNGAVHVPGFVVA